MIRACAVIRHVAAAADIGLRRREECIRARNALYGLDAPLRGRVILRLQAFHLLDVKDGVAFHKRNIAFGFFAARFVGLAAGDAGWVNDKAAFLALADMSAKFKRLFESQENRPLAISSIAFL